MCSMLNMMLLRTSLFFLCLYYECNKFSSRAQLVSHPRIYKVSKKVEIYTPSGRIDLKKFDRMTEEKMM